MKLTERQKRFIDYYIQSGNATDAAKKAGYRGNNLNRIGSENLSKLDSEIKKKLSEKDNKRVASQDQVLEYYSRLMMGEEKEVAISYDKEGNVIENKVSPSLKERTKAADALAKRYGLDKLVIESNNEVIIKDDIG